MILYRANFGDGTYTSGYLDIRDAKLAIWSRAGIVQYRSWIEEQSEGDRRADAVWTITIPSRASRNGPVIMERRS